MDPQELADRLWTLVTIAEELATHWNRKAELERAIVPVPKLFSTKAKAHNAAVEAEYQRVLAALDRVKLHYDALGGASFFPSERMSVAVVRRAALAVEGGRAVTVRGAVEIAVAEQNQHLDDQSRRRSEAHERRVRARTRRAAQHEQAMDAQRVAWAVDDARREITRHLY